MMNRSLVVLAMLFAGMGVAKAQGFELENGKAEHTYYPDATQPVDCAIHFKNLKKTAIVFAYEKVSVDYPTAWDVSFCDNRNCYATFLNNDTMAKVAPNAEASLKITVFPNGKADTAVVKYAIWDFDNPSDRDTIIWNIYIRWGANTQSWIVDMATVYPNPVKDVLTVMGVVSNKGQLVDAKGSFVKSVVLDQGRLDVSDLSAGIYSLLLETPQGVSRVGFVRQ
ncbi:MAG: T9SS type A sorting domain-containing protein [Bacteroidetes bacterium]|nr:T9SS type A sorting domain-containing protein [Bacteroidota bacterium]